jgi:hypothetical protein
MADRTLDFYKINEWNAISKTSGICVFTTDGTQKNCCNRLHRRGMVARLSFSPSFLLISTQANGHLRASAWRSRSRCQQILSPKR